MICQLCGCPTERVNIPRFLFIALRPVLLICNTTTAQIYDLLGCPRSVFSAQFVPPSGVLCTLQLVLRLVGHIRRLNSTLPSALVLSGSAAGHPLYALLTLNASHGWHMANSG